MTNARYQDAARLLDGRFLRGVVGVRRPRVVGKIGPVAYEITYLGEVVEETTGVFFRSKEYKRANSHEYRLDFAWSDQPMTVTYDTGEVVCQPAVVSELPDVTAEQMVNLYEAFTSWPGLRATSHGFEWTLDDHGQTAQELAVVVQGQARLLQRLAPTEPRQPKGPSPVDRLKERLPDDPMGRIRRSMPERRTKPDVDDGPSPPPP